MMSKMHGGKGDTPRPLGVSLEQFDANFDAIFGKKTKLPQPEMKEKPNDDIPTKECGNDNN
jgi:hypothetical protein